MIELPKEMQGSKRAIADFIAETNNISYRDSLEYAQEMIEFMLEKQYIIISNELLQSMIRITKFAEEKLKEDG
jgi:hypothetical protein